MNITLKCDDQGFGFWVVGGSEDGTQVKVGIIQPGSAAAVDGRLQTGDEIIYCNNECVIDASHRHVVGLIRSTGRRFGQVSLTVKRKIFYKLDCSSNVFTGNATDSSIHQQQVTDPVHRVQHIEDEVQKKVYRDDTERKKTADDIFV